MNRCILLLLFLVVLPACALIPQKINLRPDVFVDQINLGQGRKIFLKVEDKRSTNLIGHRGMIATGDITLADDPKDIFYQALTRILSAKGFEVIGDEKEAATGLKLTIKDIVYRTQLTILDIGITTIIDADIDVVNKSHEKYSQDYHTQNEMRVAVAPPANQNENMLNQTLNKTLTQIANDDKLFNFLCK